MADWIGIDSSHLDSFCGEETGYTVVEALDGDSHWQHSLTHDHWFIIDLGAPFNVQKVRGRSDQTRDPDDVNIYVSNDTGNWGAAVATGISTWLDTTSWVEIDTTDKEGRYVKVEVVGIELGQNPDRMRFGGLFPFFDVYGEAVAPPAEDVAVFMGANF